MLEKIWKFFGEKDLLIVGEFIAVLGRKVEALCCVVEFNFPPKIHHNHSSTLIVRKCWEAYSTYIYIFICPIKHPNHLQLKKLNSSKLIFIMKNYPVIIFNSHTIFYITTEKKAFHFSRSSKRMSQKFASIFSEFFSLVFFSNALKINVFPLVFMFLCVFSVITGSWR